MRALVKEQPVPGLTLKRVPLPRLGPTDVLINVRKAGICGTDGHIYEWDKWSQNRVHPPLIVGHEFMGAVAAVGAAVRSVAVGDRVSAEGHISCGMCLLCRTGEAHICEHVQIIGVDRDGCVCGLHRDAGSTTSGGWTPPFPTIGPPFSIRSAMPCTP